MYRVKIMYEIVRLIAAWRSKEENLINNKIYVIY